MSVELERKFLLKEIPKIEFTNVIYITQSYIVRNEDQGEIRLRHVRNGSTNVYLQAYKSIGLRSRQEVEFPIPADVYTNLMNASQAKERTITKARFIGNLTSKSAQIEHREIEIDEYLGGNHHALLIGEIEFHSESEMDRFEASEFDWIEREVTTDPHYKNYNLAITN